MKTSSTSHVQALYDDSAESYAAMMDAEIDLPIYAELLARLAGDIRQIPGPLIDTSCGPGHMLLKYHRDFDTDRELRGIDLSPKMVALAEAKLGRHGRVDLGDMRDLSSIESGTAAAVLSFFALHHIDAAQVTGVLGEWHRALAPGGRLVIAAWEGDGMIDYGEQSDVVAIRHDHEALVDRVESVGFTVERCVVEPVDGMDMPAVYLDAGKRSG